MKFKKGDKVICIDNKNYKALQKGKIYKVRKGISPMGVKFIKILINGQSHVAFAVRFRKINTQPLFKKEVKNE